MAEDPYLKFLNPENNIQLLSGNENLILDERYRRKENFERPYVAKKPERPGKSSDDLVMRRPRRNRTVFTSEQIAGLKYYFMQCNYVNTERAQQVAAKLSLGSGNVRIWFKNQRRKHKLKEIEKQKPGYREATMDPYKFTRDGIFIPSLTVPPTPAPSPAVSEIDITFSYNPSYMNSTAYQWLQHLPPMVSNDIIYNSPSHHHNMQIPQLHSFHDSVVNFNRLPYTLPSPSVTSGDGHSMTPNSNNSDTSDYFSQMSPDSEIIDPATPKSADSEAESAFNDILDSLKTPKTQPPDDDIAYEKFITAPEQKFDCKIDATFQSYDAFQSTAPSSEPSHCLELV